MSVRRKAVNCTALSKGKTRKHNHVTSGTPIPTPAFEQSRCIPDRAASVFVEINATL